MPELADVFASHGHDYLAKYAGAVLPSHCRVVRDIVSCRTPVMGGHVFRPSLCGGSAPQKLVFVGGTRCGAAMEDGVPLPSRTLKANTVIVLGLTAAFLGCVAYAAASMFGLAAPPSSFSELMGYLGVLVLAPAFVVFGIAVFLSVLRRSPKATRVATSFYFTGAGFAAFVVIASVVEIFEKGGGFPLDFFMGFVIPLAGIAAYATYCGILSLRWGRRLAQRTANPGVETDRHA